jgi:hypothetical protein
MAKALDKILIGNEPFHLKNTSLWGVPCYWIERQFNGGESLEEIIEQFIVWLRHGLSLEDVESIDKFKSDYPNLNFENFRWGIWSYCYSVFTDPNFREIVDRIFPEVKKLTLKDRVELVVPKHLDR